MEEIFKIIWLFYIYSFIGWLWETIYCSIKAGHFVYRGFLIGPITPIYGFGILGVLYFVEPFQNNLFVLYLFASLLVTTLEYLTSFLLEKFFHATWWDYHDVPLNINGRVALPVSLFWGFCCVLIVKVIHPQIVIAESWLFSTFGAVLPVLLIMITLADLIYTVTNMASFKKVTGELAEIIEENQQQLLQRRDQLTQNVEEVREGLELKMTEFQERFKEHKEVKDLQNMNWLEYLKTQDEWKDKLPKINFNQRRILNNFPNLKVAKHRNIKDLQELLAEIRKNK